ncbi:MAG: cytochrome P450 [Bacillus sp. (in: firmicutes)]
MATDSTSRIPKEKTLDSSLKLLMEGYDFIPNRCHAFQSDIFETRLLGEKVVCISGEEAARVFYDSERFTRKGAAPKRIQKTLFGENAIQAMDGEAHKIRKLLFMSLMVPSRINLLSQIAEKKWESALDNWQHQDKVTLMDASEDLLCQIACEWAGVPLQEEDVRRRAKEFAAMVDAFGAVGPRHWEGRKARKSSEQWIQKVIELIRSGNLRVQEDSAAYLMAWHKENGKLLDTRMAAIELINVLRPIVAVARFITYGALAIHQYPECRDKLRTSEEYLFHFVQEVRRFYPFSPFLGARVRQDFVWKNNHFKKDELVLLDIYGAHHDSRMWDHPDEFRPERFSEWEGNLFDLIPQGGGNAYKGHRCPGETVTMAIMKISFDFLVNKMTYAVPPQNLSISKARIPTHPKSGFIIEHIKKA